MILPEEVQVPDPAAQTPPIRVSEGPITPYIVHVRAGQGREVEQYWIEGRNKGAATRLAVRLAGVTLEQVVKIERFRLEIVGPLEKKTDI